MSSFSYNIITRHGLKEVLMDSAVAAKLVDTKAASEVKALGEFYEMLKADPDKAFYGVAHVMAANERSAVEKLLITDSLFRFGAFFFFPVPHRL